MAPLPPSMALAAEGLKVCVRNTFLHIFEDDEESMSKTRTAPVRAPRWRDACAALRGISEAEEELAPEPPAAPALARRYAPQAPPALGGGLPLPPPQAAAQAARAVPAGAAPPAPASAELLAAGPGVAAGGGARGKRTTVMLRNVPNQYTRALLQDTIDALGFAGRYDFLYFPIDFQTRAGLGYAFLNFVATTDAVQFRRAFHGFSSWRIPSPKVCNVGWGEAHQGLQAHIERYRNSPLMHESVPDVYRPILLSGGRRVPFPAPTKRIKPPRKGSERIVF